MHERREGGGPGQPLLIVKDLKKHFQAKRGVLSFGPVDVVRAVDGVSFSLEKGKTLGVVGESGCGKSTTARLLMRLIEPDEGEVILDGELVGDPDGLPVREMRRQVQMVFQDSFASLNPRLPIEETIAFGPVTHGMAQKRAAARTIELLGKVGLDPRQFVHRYPHELSGGQRQRVNIARALALDPRLLILDEAVSALDKSVEAQVLNLLIDLKHDLGLTYLFISHDLNVVQYISDVVMVMYLGQIVEMGEVETIYSRPQHPYTRALFSARPAMDPDRKTTEPPIAGDPPNPINPPSGCRFHPRCAFAEAVCSGVPPALYPVESATHVSACLMNIPASGHSQAPRLAA